MPGDTIVTKQFQTIVACQAALAALAAIPTETDVLVEEVFAVKEHWAPVLTQQVWG